MSVDQKTADMLRGQPFIGREDEQGNERVCKRCLFGVEEADNSEGLQYSGSCGSTLPPKLFNEDPLPSELDGKTVGFYCASFIDYSKCEET